MCTNKYIRQRLVRGDGKKEHEHLQGTPEREQERDIELQRGTEKYRG